MKRDTWFRVTITTEEGTRTHCAALTTNSTDDDLMAEFIDSYDPFVNPFARSPLQ